MRVWLQGLSPEGSMCGARQTACSSAYRIITFVSQNGGGRMGLGKQKRQFLGTRIPYTSTVQQEKVSSVFLTEVSNPPNTVFWFSKDKVSAVILSDTSQFKFYSKTNATLLSKILVNTQGEENILKSSRKLLILHRLGFKGLAHTLL